MSVLRVYDRPSLDRMQYSGLQTLAQRLSPTIRRYGVSRDTLSNSIISYQASNVRGLWRVLGVGINHVASHPKTSAVGALVTLGLGAYVLDRTDTFPFNEAVQVADKPQGEGKSLNDKPADVAPVQSPATEQPPAPAVPVTDVKPPVPEVAVQPAPQPPVPDAPKPAPEREQVGKDYAKEPEWSPFQRELLGVIGETDAAYWDLTAKHMRGLSAKGRAMQERFDEAARGKSREVYGDPARKAEYQGNLQRAGEQGVEAGLQGPQSPAQPAAEQPAPQAPANPAPAEGAPKN